jgi:phage-related protein
MVEAILSYVIKAIDESSSVMDRIKSSVGLLGSSLSELGGGFASVGSVMTGFAAGGVAGAAITAVGEITKGLQDCIKEAGASEAVFSALGSAVERSGTAWASVADGTKKTLLSMQAMTTYSDEQLAGALQRLMTYGLSYDQAMKALGATIDFAAAKQMDLESAAILVGKAVDGNTAIMKRYGVDITVAKDATDKFTPVLTALNDQFGGAAQAAASTYVGLQERLKNATQEVGEKIGTILLPALASLTEGMLPVVDSLGKGVDAISAWLTEVGKMPEVQGVLGALGTAFDGLMKYVTDLWQFFVNEMGPALTELMGAFKELWDALTPIAETIGELRAAFGDTSDIDLFRILIMTVVVQIKAVATIIKEVAPYIKQFADVFKAAADFIAPILNQIVTAVRFFIETLRAIFQEFETWLIRGSLWTDMWKAILAVTMTMVGQLLANLQAQLFAPMQAAFTTMSSAIQGIWNSLWAALQGALQGAVATMQGIWQGFAGFMTSAISTFQSAISGASSFLSSTLASMESAASAAVSSIQSMLSSAWSSVTSATASMASAISSANVAATTAAASTHDIIGTADLTSNIISKIGPTVPSCPEGYYWNGSACVPYPAMTPPPAIQPAQTYTAPPSPTTLNATIPVTVQVDSQTVSKVVQKSIVSSIDYAGRRL